MDVPEPLPDSIRPTDGPPNGRYSRAFTWTAARSAALVTQVPSGGIKIVAEDGERRIHADGRTDRKEQKQETFALRCHRLAFRPGRACYWMTRAIVCRVAVVPEGPPLICICANATAHPFASCA